MQGLIDSIWRLENNSKNAASAVVIPDGKIDLFLYKDKNEPFQIFLSGIWSKPLIKPPFPHSKMFVISFTPLAAEYVFKRSLASIRDGKIFLPSSFWDFSENDLNDFKKFCKNVCQTIQSLVPLEIDLKKIRLFDLIFSSKGQMTVKQLSEKTDWSSRQMNRYFNTYLGLPLKTYCNIVRFSNSMKQLKARNLYPELYYADQSHFIREVKKFTGVGPAILSNNKDDRFIQLTLLPDK